MSERKVHLSIPVDAVLPQIITDFSLEETFEMIKAGCDFIQRSRNVALNLSYKEIYKKVKDETKEEIQKLELDLQSQREIYKRMEEKMEMFYHLQEEQMIKKNEKLEEMVISLKEQLKEYELEKEGKIQESIHKEREKMNILLEEKEKQNQLNREAFENAIKLTNRSNSHKGSDGERTFKHYAETFKDFKGFDIVDKHTQGGEGDFHMHFEEFDVLVDAKNYKKAVPSREREKIKSDLLKNEHITFAWLVSLNTVIDKYDKAPIMFEWVSTNKCICYINHLMDFEDPAKILRITWFSCKELLKLINDDSDISELTSLREYKFKMNDKIKNVRKIIRELNTTFGVIKKQIDNVDYELRDLLEIETSEMVNSGFSLFDNWWSENIEQTLEDTSLVSTDIWFKFKQDNKDCVKEFDITPDKLRDYIKSKFSMTSYSIRNKNSSSAIDLKWVKWKTLDVVKMEVEINENAIKKKVVKKVPKVTEVNSDYV